MKNFFILTFLTLLSNACGLIPSSYQGEFRDDAAGVTLTLSSQKGILTQSNGEIIEAKAQSLKFEKLLKAETGIYIIKNAIDKNLLEVYWIQPHELPRKEEGGLTWFRGEVYLTFFDIEKTSLAMQLKENTNEIILTHCSEGRVMLDTIQKRWQVGCPAGAKVYQLLRTK